MMAIRGIDSNHGFYNNYRVNHIPSVPIDKVKGQEDPDSALQSGQEDISPLKIAEIEDDRRQNTDLENVSLTFNKGNTFDYIGSDSEIGNLDVQKAVSDMKKDQILEEYQYFYGTNHLISQSEDGIVVKKTNL